MRQENVAVVLDPGLAFDKARGQIAQLAEEVRHDADQREIPDRQLHAPHPFVDQAEQHHAERAADQARDEAGPGLVRADVRRELLVAERHAAEHGKAVTDERHDERHQHERRADIAQQRNAAVHCRE